MGSEGRPFSMFVKAFALKWEEFENHIASSVQLALEGRNYSDVTLVSDDLIPFYAHKSIVSACSPVIKNHLLNNPHDLPLIYMKGIKQQLLKPLLEFMYLGKVEIHESDVKEFFEIAEELRFIDDENKDSIA